MSIVRSILDNDLYTFTQQRAILGYKQNVPVRYRFNNRRKEGKFNHDFMVDFEQAIASMVDVKATKDEIGWFKDKCPFLGHDYFEYLRNYRFDPSEVKAKLVDGDLDLEINGTWERTEVWEVALMATISELYFVHCDKDWKKDTWIQYEKAKDKAEKLKGIAYTDFGTRRRRNYATQNLIVSTHKCQSPTFMGTSNVHLAMKHDTRPIGTQSHQWTMGISALESLRHANRFALRIWSDIYKGELGTALPDTFGTDAFWSDFDSVLARLFDGVRHDSGDPYKFGDRAIDEYRRLRINPIEKSCIFSDGLDTDLAVKIHDYFFGRIKTAFGIGTHFTNDFEKMDGSVSKALNMVIKLVMCDGIDVVKLSDTPSKAIGERDALRIAKNVFYGTPLDA